MSWSKTVVEGCQVAPVPLTVEECLDLLETVTVGRVVYTQRALPVIRPTYVAVDGERILLRVVTGVSLGSVGAGSVVAVEAGSIDRSLCAGWSVTVTGRILPAAGMTGRSFRLAAADGCAELARGALLEMEAGLVSGYRLVPGLERGPSPSCDSGTSQMTSTPPSDRPSTRQVPPS